jgi:exonuclease SbcC
MRPGLLTLEGLSCFKDKQEIDLAPLDLFAISGPTGAGKSTLLDAVTFALYGEVPRVAKEDRSEMISASRDRVSVVLEFEVGTDRYRIARILRRTGGHSVRFEKHDGNDFTVNLADQVRSASEKVVEILGLDAGAFMQAVVLPQGEFAKFLKAQPRERRNMLRSLLRLDVYERMREQAQRVASAKKTTVESTRKVLGEEYASVDDDALAGLEERHRKLSEDLKRLRTKRDEAQQRLIVLRAQYGRSVELSKKEAEWKALQHAAAEIDSAREQVTAAQRAAPLVSFLDEAKRAEATAAAAAKQLNAARNGDEEARAQGATKSTALEAAEKDAEAIPALREQIAALNQIVGRQPEVQSLEKAIAKQTTDIDTFTTEVAKLDAAVKTALALQGKHSAAIQRAQDALNASGYDSSLDALVESVRGRAIELGVTRRSASEGKDHLGAKQKALEELRTKLTPLEEDTRTLEAKVEERRTALQSAENALHEAHQLHAANYLRDALEPDAPCPVCEQTVASPPPANLAPAVEAAKKRVTADRKRLEDSEVKARSAQDALTRGQASVAAEENAIAGLTDRCRELESEVSSGAADLRDSLAQHAPPADILVEVWIAAAVTSIAEKRKVHGEAKEARDEAWRALDKAKADEAVARERLVEKRSALSRTGEERRSNQERLATLRGEIAAVTESDDPGAEASALAKQVEAIEGVLKSASAEAADAKNRMTSAKETVRLTAEAAKKAYEEAATRTRRRDEEIGRAGFADEAAVRAALLDEETSNELNERLREHDQDTHTVDQRIKTLQEELGDVRVSDQDLAAADKAAEDLNAEVEKQHGEQKTLEDQIEQMKKRLERSNTMRVELASDEKDLRIYNQLAGDLRSDKFQAYVLEETFTELVQGASARLLSLTGERYSLLFKEGEILVVDNDNAGETRISDTLSGGETFLTSLSLALELSDQVQRAAGAVNLDSLFIDEGFGTLDPDTLALVSETIQNLRVGGRMVGIITHIPELRDEFAQQIIVTKHQGYSTVEVRGPFDEIAGA